MFVPVVDVISVPGADRGFCDRRGPRDTVAIWA